MKNKIIIKYEPFEVTQIHFDENKYENEHNNISSLFMNKLYCLGTWIELIR